MRSAISLFVLGIFCLIPKLYAQDNYFANWFNRVDKTQAEQPHWITPLATTTPRLEEEFRYDQLWQENAKGVTTDNYDGGKGLELIPFEKVEVIFNFPPHIDHNSAASGTAGEMWRFWSSTDCFPRTRSMAITY